MFRSLTVYIVLFCASFFATKCQKKPHSAEALRLYWQLPVPPQGQPPAHFSATEASLAPESCGSCHSDKFTMWRTSPHAHALTPGVVGQLPGLDFTVQKDCLKCHTPLSEQTAAYFSRGIAGTLSAVEARHSQFDTPGITCAGCHVREHKRYGPGRGAMRGPAHDGAVAKDFFRESQFCSGCHQFEETQTRIGGKLLQDVYGQWSQTSFAQDGTTCQSCHMREQRHEWPGIQKKEFVEPALLRSVHLEADAVSYTLTNAGAGHHLPTYSVPEITAVLEGIRLNGSRSVLDRYIVGWRISNDLKSESYDTRLASGESVTRRVALIGRNRYVKFVLRVEVNPKAHYERLFNEKLAQQKLGAASRRLLRSALAGFEKLHYSLADTAGHENTLQRLRK